MNIDIKNNSIKTYNSIDLAKFIMAVAVIAIHTNPTQNSRNQIINNLYENVICMAVPFFFLATGYLLAKRMDDTNDKSNILLVRKHLIKLIKMYVSWMIIYMPMAVYHDMVSHTPRKEAFISYIRGFLFMGEQYNAWQLWYLLSSIYALILIIILFACKIPLKKILWVSLAFVLLSVGIDWFMMLETDIPYAMSILQKLIKYSIEDTRIFRGIIYISIGMYLANNKISLKISIAMFSAGFIINYFLQNRTLKFLLLIVTMIGLFGIIEKIHLKDNKIYPILRRVSTVMYLIHMYIWSFYYFIVYGQKTLGVDSFIVTTILSCLVGFIYVHISMKLRHKERG